MAADLNGTSHIFGCEVPGCPDAATVELQVWEAPHGWRWTVRCTAHVPSAVARGKKAIR